MDDGRETGTERSELGAAGQSGIINAIKCFLTHPSVIIRARPAKPGPQLLSGSPADISPGLACSGQALKLADVELQPRPPGHNGARPATPQEGGLAGPGWLGPPLRAVLIQCYLLPSQTEKRAVLDKVRIYMGIPKSCIQLPQWSNHILVSKSGL